MLLECNGLTKKYGHVEAVSDLTLSLREGTLYGLLGENGSGKTTWMKMVAGLTRPNNGTILYKGAPLSYRDKENIAYMATESFFYDFMKVADVGKYYADFFPGFSTKRFQELILRMGIDETRKVRHLSSGMTAKVKLAATLSRNAELYLLDEPLNGIDYKAREEIINLILEEADESRTFVISTHLLEEVESFIENAIFFRDGQLVSMVNLEAERMKSGRSLGEIYMDIM